MVRSPFGVLLSQRRARAGLSGGQLARAAGITTSYVTRLQRGEREPPRLEVLERLVIALRYPHGAPYADEEDLYIAAGYLPPGWADAMARLRALEVALGPVVTLVDRAR